MSGAVEFLRGSDDFIVALAQITIDALEKFTDETGVELTGRDVKGAALGVVKQFGVGAKAEVAFAASLSENVVPPTPADEKAGIDIRTESGETFQIKASTKKRSRWSAKEADHLIWAKVDGKGRIEKFEEI